MNEDGYRALVARTDKVAAAIAQRRAGDLACRKGCTACCHVQLTLSPVEARSVRRALAGLDRETRGRLRERARAFGGAACVMLEADGGCAVYAHRPLVCRTQGHALRYPSGTLHEEARFAVSSDGDITWCPLNYALRAPASEDVLEASRIDELLARSNLEACEPDRAAALERVSMRELALEP